MLRFQMADMLDVFNFLGSLAGWAVLVWTLFDKALLAKPIAEIDFAKREDSIKSEYILRITNPSRYQVEILNIEFDRECLSFGDHRDVDEVMDIQERRK